jgi:hypothetical protein
MSASAPSADGASNCHATGSHATVCERPPAALFRDVPGRTILAIECPCPSSVSISAVPRNPVDPETKMRIWKASRQLFPRYGGHAGKVN